MAGVEAILHFRVYISHGRSDVPLVAALFEDLQSLGHDVWLDRAVPGGEGWWGRIARNVERCDLFIVALSATATDNPICAAELALASAYGKPILPVLVEDGVADAFVPPTIAEIQRVDYRSADRTAMANLVRALQATPVPTATPAVDAMALRPAAYTHDVASELASMNYLTPDLQMDIVDQLRATTEGGLHLTKVVNLLQQFSDRDDTTAKVAVKIDALRTKLREIGDASGAVYRLELHDLPEQQHADRDIPERRRTTFLSYSRLDRGRVADLAADIEGIGWDVWLDQKLPGGRKWWDEVLRRIRESDVVVFAASRASVSSRACQSELAYARALARPLIGVVVDSQPAGALLTPHFADAPVLSYNEPSKESLGALYRALAATPPAVALPDPLPEGPEVPATYMFDMRSQIQSKDVLTPSDQEQLLAQLRAYSDEGYPEREVVELAGELHGRDDVTRRISEELEAFTAEIRGDAPTHTERAEVESPAGEARSSTDAASSEPIHQPVDVSRDSDAPGGAEPSSAAAAPEPTAAAGPSPSDPVTPEPADEPVGAAHVAGAKPVSEAVRMGAVAHEPPPAVTRAHAGSGAPKRRRGVLAAVLIAVLAAGAGAVAVASGSGDDRTTTPPQGSVSSDDAEEDASASAPAADDAGSQGSVSDDVNDEEPVYEWELAALIPSVAGGLALSDYTLETSTSSSNCEDYDAGALVLDEALVLRPRTSPDHFVWAWTARFDSLNGVNSYLASWGEGCEIRPPEAPFVVRLVPPTWLTDEALWYVTLIDFDDGPVVAQSVGVLAYNDRWVAEAQLVLHDADGSIEIIEVDTSAPYASSRAAELAQELVDPVARFLDGS